MAERLVSGPCLRLLTAGLLLLAFGWREAGTPAGARAAAGFVQPLTSGTAVVAPSVTLTSSAAGATGVTYLIDFTTSPTGALTKNVDTITVAAPAGTTLSGSADLFDLNTEQEIGFSGPPVLVGGTQATWTVANSVPAGDALEIRIGDVANPPAGTYAVNVSTSADTTPVATPSYTLTAPQAVLSPSVTLTSYAAGAAGVTYLVDLTTSSTGGLAAAGGTITVAAPAGTVIPSYGITIHDVTTGEDLTAGAAATPSNGGATVTWPVFDAIPAGHLIELIIPSVTNASGTGGHLTITTSSDSVPAQTPDFTLSAAQPVASPTLAISNQAAGATGVVYTVDFTTSSTGGLAGTHLTAGGTIAVAAPAGTSIPSAGITLRDVTTGEDLTTDAATLSNGGATATWPTADAVPAGHRVRLIIPGVTNPAAGTTYQLTVSTSSDTAAQTPVYQIGPNPISPSVGPTAVLSSLAAGIPGVSYTVIFTTGGALAGGSGTITLQAPAGTVFPNASIDVVDLTADQDLGSTLGQSLSNSGSTATWTVRNDVPAAHEIELRIPDVTNPDAGTGTIAISTSSDTTPASTPSYTIVAPGAVSAPSVLVSSAAAGIAQVTYTVDFTTSITGGLAGRAGTVTLQAPAGTDFSGDGPTYDVQLFDLNTGRALGGTSSGPTLSNGGATATWPVGTPLAAGHQIRMVIPGVTNPPRGSASVQVSTSSDPTSVPAPATTFVAPQAVSSASLLRSSTAPSVANVTYTVSFTTSSTGALAGRRGTITLQAPAGTDFSGNGPTYNVQLFDVTTDRALGGTAAGPTLSNGGATATWPVGAPIPAGHRIRMIIPGVTNPAASGVTITVNTSSDAATATTAARLVSLSVALAGNEAGSVTDGSGAIACPGTCTADYPAGTMVTLTATPASPDSGFAGWSGDGCSGTGTCTITIGADTAVTATFNTTLIVTTATDAGPGTLRDTITRSNAYPGPHVIEFDISGLSEVPIVLATLSPLPAITVPVTIDGTTQPGYSGTPLIQLDGLGITQAGPTGLDVRAGSTTVRGLEINGWSGQGVILEGNGGDTLAADVVDHNGGATGQAMDCGICITSPDNTVGGTEAGARNAIFGNDNGIDISGSGATGNIVEGNYIGLTLSGSTPLGGGAGAGILIDGAPNNTIGGIGSGARNVISGNGNDGIDIDGIGASGNIVEGNYIGLDPTGMSELRNLGYGVKISEAPNNTIGGLSAGAGNVISGNGAGMYIERNSATGNVVEGNYIGTDATGEHTPKPQFVGALQQATGIELWAPGNTVGGTSPAARNVISGNVDTGIATGVAEIYQNGQLVVYSPGSNEVIQGNYIGVDALGTSRLGNGNGGVYVTTANNTIGGTAPGARNVISGNTGVGVVIQGHLGGFNAAETFYATGNTIQGNYIGTDATGAASIGNSGPGVQIAVGSLATDNTVSGNVISGNGGAGVDVQANSNTIQGNDIGTDVSGKNALPNQAGVKVVGTGNTIGGTAAGTGNVISGNTADGIDISFATIQNGPSSTQNTTVQGNDIGVDAAGETALGNGGSGVVITGQNDTSNLIGGTSRGARNVIAANKGQGIEIDDAGGDTIQGNYVGTDAAGATLLANGGAGILLNGPHNTIGGTAAGAGNLIDGTGAAVYSGGVYVSTASAVTIASAGNTLQGNVIGTNASETAELSRFFYDVAVFGPSNAIGGTAPGAGNVITGGYGGVQVGGQENPILGNSIFGNSVTVSGKTISGGGIALLKGANGGEPAPVLAPVKDSRTSTTISGLVKPGMHRIEVFANPSCSDPEGKTLLGDVVTTKATWSLTIGKLPAGEGITATSTNTATSNTSPFSACRATPRG